METKNTLFTASTFQKIWKNHFIPEAITKSFKFLEGVDFYKSKTIPYYFNVGKNLTKGITYSLNNNIDIKNNVLVIYDVLPHLLKNNANSERIGVLKSFQYPGFLINLNQFKNIDDYLLKTFSKNTRMKMRKFSNRLEQCFNISTEMYFGNIDKTVYNQLFEDFLNLLDKRYSEKQIIYNNMQPDEWNFYKDVAYPLILEKKASLFVIYDNNRPIAITYNYHTEDAVIDAITVFDIDYSKFNLGYVNNLKLLDWCFKHKVKTLDFSKGFFDYKSRMCSLKYNFEYHIIYNKKSVSSKLKANLYFYFLELKLYLRNKGINSKFHKLNHVFKNGRNSKPAIEINIINLEKLPDLNEIESIDIKEVAKYDFLKKHINDFLYLVTKPYHEIKIYKLKNQKDTYILSSNANVQQIEIIN